MNNKKNESFTKWKKTCDEIKKEEKLLKNYVFISGLFGDNTREEYIKRLKKENWERYLVLIGRKKQHNINLDKLRLRWGDRMVHYLESIDLNLLRIELKNMKKHLLLNKGD